MNGIGGIGRRPPGGVGATGLAGPGEDLEALAPAGLDAADAAEALDELATLHGAALARLAGHPRTVDDMARTLAPGRAMAALARFVRRGPRPGESPQERKMRELVARLLDLRQEAAAAMGVVQVG
jgi:hypothetical protein